MNRRKALAFRIRRNTRDALQDELDYNRRLQPIQLESNERQEALRVRQLPQIAAQLEKLHQDVEITRAKLASLLVRAPVAGRMTSIDLKVGENRNRGERLGELTPESGFKVVAAVDEYYLGRLRAGQTATGEIAGRELPLAIERVYPQVRDGTFTVDLKFTATPPDGPAARPGDAGKVRAGHRDYGHHCCPSVRSCSKAAATGYSWSTTTAARHRRQIRVGRRNIEQLEILGGLAPGERVITSDYTGYDGIDRIDIQ